MEKFNKVMWAIYWAMFIVVSVATVLYCTVEKARSWLNRHVVMPYVKGCEKLGEETEKAEGQIQALFLFCLDI